MKPNAVEGTPVPPLNAADAHRKRADDIGSTSSVNDFGSRLALDGVWQRLLDGGYLDQVEHGPLDASKSRSTRVPVPLPRSELSKEFRPTKTST
jgi:hypothetical protein